MRAAACCSTDFIRHEIGATGTHVGCEHGVLRRLHHIESMAGRPAPA